MSTGKISATDREGISNFQRVANGTGVAASRRDASNTSATNGSAGPWTHPPTPIPNPASRSLTMDPYSGRLTDNLDSVPRMGNPVARRNPVEFAREQARRRGSSSPRTGTGPSSPKRRKLNLNKDPSEGLSKSGKHAKPIRNFFPGECNTNAASSSALQPITSPKRAKRSKYSFPEVEHTPASRLRGKKSPKDSPDVEVMIIDDDEDLGEIVHTGTNMKATSPSSPDPLNIISADDELHPFDTDEPIGGPSSRSTSLSERAIPSDGPSTSRLQAKHAITRQEPEVNIVDDDIEDPDKPWWPNNHNSSSKVENLNLKGNTKLKAGLYERNNKGVPSINLNAIIRTLPNRKAAMKAGRQLAMQPIPIGEPLPGPTSSKPPSAGPSKPTLRQQRVIELPLEAWSLGCRLHDPQDTTPDPFVFSYDTSAHKLTIKAGQIGSHTALFREFRVAGEFVNIKYERDARYPLMQLTTRPSVQSARVDGFTPGSKSQEGLVTFKFCKSSKHFKPTDYQSVVNTVREILHHKSDAVDEHGAKSVWSVVENAWELYARRSQRNGTSPIRESPSVETATRWQWSASQLAADSSSSTVVAEPVKASGPPRPRPAYKGPGPATESETPSGRLTRSLLGSRPDSPMQDPDELILVYPPAGIGAVNITQGDLSRLDPGEFLNDTLIEFGLKLWLHELRSSDPQLADQIHVFSSFFYKKLNTRNREEGYQSVRKWTSKFDLFKKKYIIVPINENLHWYLAIIYEPEHVLAHVAESLSVAAGQQVTRQGSTEGAEQANAETNPAEAPPPDRPASPANTNESGLSSRTRGDEDAVEAQLFASRSNTESLDGGPASPMTEKAVESGDDDIEKPVNVDEDERDELRASSLTPLGSDVEMEVHSEQNEATESVTSSKESGIPASRFYSSSWKGKQKARLAPFPMEVDDDAGAEADESADIAEDGRPSTYIFTLDSLNASHKQVINVLTQYLRWEAKDKKGVDDTNKAVGMQAHVPLQPNYCDCGLYLLHFAKTFMKDPSRLSRLIQSRKKGTDADRRTDWDAQTVGDFRDELGLRIRQLSEEWKRERAAKEEERKKLEAEGGAKDNATAEDSDDDIVVEDVRPAAANGRTPRGVKRKDRTEDTPAARIR